MRSVLVALALAACGPRGLDAETAQARDLEVNRAYAATSAAPEALAESRRPIVAQTVVEVRGEQFFINGRPTYEGRTWRGARVEGLLLNARMVQGVFDDINPATRDGWAYPDTRRWDPERNTNEFVAAMPSWREAGLLGISVNLQGGNAHADNEEWVNTAFASDGALYGAYFSRLRRILEEADRQGMVVILGLFYFRHDEALENEAAVVRAVDETVNWLHDVGARNVIIEINNECDIRYDHAILRCDRVHELLQQVRANVRNGWRFPVSTSLQGGAVPPDSIIANSDFILLHGNSISEPQGIADMITRVRASPVWSAKPIVFNEDDHHGFDRPENNFTTAVTNYASWGFYDRRRDGESFANGFQSVPVDWRINSPRKQAFFDRVREITGAE